MDQEQNQEQSSGMVEEQPSMEPQTQYDEAAPAQEKSTGGVIGIIIVVIILIVAGVYLFTSRGTSPEDVQKSADETTEMLMEQGASDELPAIEADLNADLGDLDAELDQINKELEGI